MNDFFQLRRVQSIVRHVARAEVFSFFAVLLLRIVAQGPLLLSEESVRIFTRLWFAYLVAFLLFEHAYWDDDRT